LTILYGIAIQATDYQVKRLDPFYRLAESLGCLPRCLVQDPVSWWTHLISPHRAGWRIWVSSVITIIATAFVPTIQNASLVLGQEMSTEKNYVYVSSIWSRLLTSCLALVTVLILFILVMLLREKSGLISSVEGFSGILAMVTKSYVLQDFRDMDLASNDHLWMRLKHRRYILYKGSLWQGQWDRRAPKARFGRGKPYRMALATEILAPLWTMCLILLFITPILIFTPGNIVLLKLPWSLTAIGVFTKMICVQFDMHSRSVEPYWQLIVGNASPLIFTVEYTGIPLPALPFRAVANGHTLLVWVSINSILIEVLVVCLASFGLRGSHFYRRAEAASVPFNADDGETFTSFWLSFALSMVILCSLIASLTAHWAQRRRFWIPQQPGSIASIIAYFYASRLLEDFVNTEHLTSRQHTIRLVSLNKRYGLG
jgi:hypothetical protein